MIFIDLLTSVNFEVCFTNLLSAWNPTSLPLHLFYVSAGRCLLLSCVVQYLSACPRVFAFVCVRFLSCLNSCSYPRLRALISLLPSRALISFTLSSRLYNKSSIIYIYLRFVFKSSSRSLKPLPGFIYWSAGLCKSLPCSNPLTPVRSTRSPAVVFTCRLPCYGRLPHQCRLPFEGVSRISRFSVCIVTIQLSDSDISSSVNVVAWVCWCFFTSLFLCLFK